LEVRSWKHEVGSTKLEARSWKHDVGGTKLEARSWKHGVGSTKLEDGRPKTGDGSTKLEARSSKREDQGKKKHLGRYQINALCNLSFDLQFLHHQIIYLSNHQSLIFITLCGQHFALCLSISANLSAKHDWQQICF
jgi:hypothetical protein